MDRDITPTAPLLEIDAVSRVYRPSRGLLGLGRSEVRAVDGVSLDVTRGETLGLVGESGCGKSTLARLILGLESPNGGDIRFDGHSILPAPDKEFRRRVQMIFQDPYSSLNPRRSVGATVGEPLKIFGLGDAAERKARVAELLELVGLLPEHAGRYPHEFSGGQRQRIAIARSLALSPDLVVCDEAVSALDVSIQAQIIGLLGELQERMGLTYVFISHDLAVVNYVSRRVAVMYLGRLVELAGRDDLYAEPLHPYTRALLAAVPEPDPRARKQREPLADDTHANLPGCGFAPRCARADETCHVERPQWREARQGHFVACHRPG